MAFMTAARVVARFLPQPDTAVRTVPECVVLGVRDGVVPSSEPPVRLFLGTEPAQYRAERVFVWSIEQVRDPSRVYEIYLMKELVGFDRRGWITGFTNYRFAVPHFAGNAGRAIYNDVGQVYLTDPGELFDTNMGDHGFLAIPDIDSSVMLIDCIRMASIWTLETAQRERKQSLLAKALAVPGLRGNLAPEWHARDEEYLPGCSKLLHYATLHTQPWRPFPRRFVYLRSPVSQVWFDLERSADNAGYQVFSSARPSAQYTALLARLRMANCRDHGDRPQAARRQLAPDAEAKGLQDLITQVNASTILDYGLGQGDDGHRALEESISGCTVQTVTRYDPAFPPLARRPSGRFDGVACTEVLDYLPDADVPWVIEELFSYACRFVYAAVAAYSRTKLLPDGTRLWSRPRDQSWWYAQFEAVSTRHPEVHWKLVLHTRTVIGRRVTLSRAGGRRLGGPPTVWVLADNHPGNTTQSVGLAGALGWPYEVKELRFTALARLHERLLGPFGATRIGLNRARSASLAPPWPDLVIATGGRPAHVARWIGKQSLGCTRLVQLGRRGSHVAELFDAVVSCAHFFSPPHPRRIETVAPLTRVTPERLAQAAERWKSLFDNAPHPRIALLVGGPTPLYRLDMETARRMGEDVRAFAQTAGGSVFVTTSRRTGPKAAAALRTGLGESGYMHQWQPGQQDNPYLAYLALADVLVVTGESESMLAEAAASGKPMYIYPLPGRQPGLRGRLKEWVVARAHARPLNKRGTVRPQQGVEYLCALLFASGFVRPRRDLNALHHTLIHLGIARFFGEPLETGERPVLREADEVARKVRMLLGFTDP